MTLADLISMPAPLDQLQGLALVFSADLRDRLVAVQGEHGRPQLTVYPAGPTTDGRYYHCADILEEVGAGGMYGAGFAHLDNSRFVDVAVIALADAVAMLPVNPPQP